MLGEDGVVIVPPSPGPLVRTAPEGVGDRRRDDLDELIDELLPDTSEGPGAIDAALVGGGAALLGWTALGSPPGVATVAGIAALGLGCILPLRAGWRRLADRRHARLQTALMARGTPVRTGDPEVARLVAAYEALDGMASTTPTARAAAHGALLEVATLLDGRVAGSDRERRYVADRAHAVENLAAALGELGAAGAGPGEAAPAVDPSLVVEAREELDAIGGASSVSRIDDLTAELRARGRNR